jgi:hypothetical protein
MHEKRGTPLLPVPLLEVFELTRFIETSNEDPTPYVYIKPHIPQRYNIDIILHTHEHLSLPGFRMNLKCSKFQEVPNQAPINAFTTMLALYQPPLLSGFGAELAERCTFRHTILLCKDSQFATYYSHLYGFFKKV